MSLLNSIAAAISKKSSLKSFDETNYNVKASFAIEQITEISDSALSASIHALPSRDKITLSLNYEHSAEPISLHSTENSSISSFISEVHSRNVIAEHEEIKLDIEIIKNRESKTLTVYSLENLVRFWSTPPSINVCLDKITDISTTTDTLEIQDFSESFSTSLLTFKGNAENANISPKTSKEDIIKKRDKCAFFANSTQYNFIPEDFAFDTPPSNTSLRSLFDNLCTLFSLIYICDHSRIIQNNGVSLKLNGYKAVSEEIKNIAEEQKNSTHTAFDIYQWVYTDGNVSDKIGVARNIISIHIDNRSLREIPQETLSAIVSGYQIYLKDNLKQYIEVKNKISEAIQKSSDRASDIAKNIGTTFRASIFTLYSFFFSIFLFRVVSGKNPTLEVTLEIYLIFISFLAISILALAYNIVETNDEEKRLTESYETLKERYKELISKKDLENILAKDKEHKLDISYIRRKSKRTRSLWLLSLFIAFLLMTTLRIYNHNTSSSISNRTISAPVSSVNNTNFVQNCVQDNTSAVREPPLQKAERNRCVEG